MKKEKMGSFLEEKPTGFLIVGIGASAGGIHALKEFFKQVAPDSGMAYVVILHLSPDHDSKLAQVLQTVSSIEVTQVTEKVKVEPDHIYVVPPNQHLSMVDDSIIPLANMTVEDRRAPVDIFFRTLADTHGPRAICVVLSGTGANGSMGLKRIKEMGGVTFVQNPKEAEFNEMPRNAIATELVDEVLPVAEIPPRIIAYRNSLGSIQIAVDPLERPDDEQQALRAIFHQLRLQTGHDFSNYKQPTVLRRIERRINIRNIPDLPSYVAFMQNDQDETVLLLKDLLISVTNFFRDKKAFDVIEQEVLPQVLQRKSLEDQVRIWVAGCATGEEAYSMAILYAERTQDIPQAPKIQIFATDIDEAAIATGREGFYTLNDAADISPERLRRFFMKEQDGYRVRREIREMILFANHNFLKDPPFSRIDIISCRNVLIYLNRTAQERVMETFHFSLQTGGFLFLGSSETVDGASDLYATFSREHHIFKSRQAVSKTLPLPQSIPNFRFPTIQTTKKSDEKEPRPPSELTFGLLHQKLLEEYAPPSVVVNEEYDIVHMSKTVGRYLKFSAGEPTRNLLKLVQQELRLELRSALYQAVQGKTAVEARDVKWSENGTENVVNLLVRPVLRDDDPSKGFILVLFRKKEDNQQDEQVVVSSGEPVTQQLEEELLGLKAQLRISTEQHDYQAEELRASNEELQAMNEELRSAAEEMETSKEELQSINEELRTVNQELKIKVEEMSLTSNNLQNLINSTDIGTIFLDNSLHVVLYTPPIRDIFNLIPSDYSRLITDITHKLDYTGLAHDAETVLEKLKVVEREVTANTGRTFTMRLLPYRTDDNRIGGVVITFFDITSRKEAEKALRESEEHKEFLLTLNDRIRELNDAVEIEYEAARLVAEQLKADRVHFAEINEDDQLVVHKEYVRGDAPLVAEIYKAEEILGALKLKRAETVVIPDTEVFALLSAEEKATFAAAKIRSQLSVAISKMGKKVASFAVDQTTPREWTQLEISILQEATERTWAAVERARIEQANAADIRDTLLLRELSIKLIGEGNVQVLYDEILATAVKLLHADAGTIQLYQEDSQQLMLLSSLGINGITERFTRLDPTSTSSSGQSLLTRKRVFLIFDDQSVPDPGGYNKIHLEAGLLSGQATPLITRSGKLIGIISTQWKQHRRPKERELSFLDLLARQAADLIQQRHAEEAIRQSEARFRTVTDSVPQVIWTNDAEGRANFFNRRWYEYTGLTYEESADLGWQVIVLPEQAAASTEKWKKALAAGEIFDTEYMLRGFDGTYRWFIGRNVPLKDAAGNITGWFGSATDIEDLKKTAEALSRSEARLRITMESATDYAVITMDTERRIERWSNGATNIFGYTEAEVIGKSADIIFTEEDKKARVPQKEMETARDTGRAADERWHIREDGSRFYASGVLRPIQNNGLTGYVKVLRDMTQQQLFTEELHKLVAERTAELRRSNEDLGQFAHVASHDLKEPVRKIKTFNNRIIDDFGDTLPERVKTYLNKIGNSADRMFAMIEGVLNYSKAGSAQQPTELVDLNEIIREITSDLEELLRQKQGEIKTENLPTLSGYRILLYQLFYNLVLNSLKFAKASEPSLINIACVNVNQDKKKFYEITLSDNGIGFEQEFAESIFGTFTRLNSADEYEGTGLGLALCKKIVERHRGSISAYGELNKGATFIILLPVT